MEQFATHFFYQKPYHRSSKTLQKPFCLCGTVRNYCLNGLDIWQLYCHKFILNLQNKYIYIYCTYRIIYLQFNRSTNNVLYYAHIVPDNTQTSINWKLITHLIRYFLIKSINIPTLPKQSKKIKILEKNHPIIFNCSKSHPPFPKWCSTCPSNSDCGISFGKTLEHIGQCRSWSQETMAAVESIRHWSTCCSKSSRKPWKETEQSGHVLSSGLGVVVFVLVLAGMPIISDATCTPPLPPATPLPCNSNRGEWNPTSMTFGSCLSVVLGSSRLGSASSFKLGVFLTP